MSKSRDAADQINRVNSSAANATAITIDANENVGIATSSPSNPLTVDGDNNSIRIRHSGNNNFRSDYAIASNGQTTINSYKDGDNQWQPIRLQGSVVTHWTSGSERLRVDSSGNVGIGVVPSTKLHVKNGTNQNFNVFGPSVFSNGVTIASTTDGFTGYVEMEQRASQFAWHNGTTERMRLDASGLLVGTTDNNVAFTNTVGIALKDGHAQMSQDGNGALYLNRKGTNGATQYFHKDGTAVGSVSVTASATAYNTSSDYRLKENITPVQGAADTVMAMQPCTYTAKADGLWYDGFLAHELQEVHPRAVQGTKDAMKDEEYEITPAVYEDVVTPAVEAVAATYDDEGLELTPAVEATPETTESVLVTEAVMGTRSVPDMQSVDYSKLTPILTAALQEALTAITDLKARVAILEEGA